MPKNYFPTRISAKRAAVSQDLVVRVCGVPTEIAEQFQSRALESLLHKPPVGGPLIRPSAPSEFP